MKSPIARAKWLVALAGVSCAPVAVPSPPAPEPPVSPAPLVGASEAPQPETRSAEDQALQAKLTDALGYVSEIRGLRAKAKVEGRLITRSEIEAYLQGELEREAPQDMVQATEALLYAFGTVPADFDYRASVTALMTQQLLGFYDPRQKAFFVSGDLSGQEADITLWHELVHALQDQHYDLTNLTEWEADRGDALAAVHALAEGDATSAMLDAMLKPRGSTALEVPDGLMRAESILGSAAGSAPRILVASLVAPYVDGLAFVNARRKSGGFAAVDATWQAPPVSTEQLLHPDKYLAQEPPLVVPLPPAPPIPGFVRRYHDVMGEQTLRILLEEWLPARTAVAAASDWGGDRLAVFSDESRQVWAVGWHVRFDSSPAAERALLAFARSAALTELPRDTMRQADAPSEAKKHVRSDKLCRPRRDQGAFALVRHGASLAIAAGPFRRDSAKVQDDPGCKLALAWATSMATAR